MDLDKKQIPFGGVGKIPEFAVRKAATPTPPFIRGIVPDTPGIHFTPDKKWIIVRIPLGVRVSILTICLSLIIGAIAYVVSLRHRRIVHLS
jgi:hypothetical protein